MQGQGFNQQMQGQGFNQQMQGQGFNQQWPQQGYQQQPQQGGPPPMPQTQQPYGAPAVGFDQPQQFASQQSFSDQQYAQQQSFPNQPQQYTQQPEHTIPVDAASMFTAAAASYAASGGDSSQFANVGIGLGEQMGRQAFEQGKETLSRWGFGLDSVRGYFQVDQSYVLSRLKLLAFPWPIGKRKLKDWRRRYNQSENGDQKPMSPREDENAPDLYIPVMAFITYVLAAGFWLGVAGQFTPEILGKTLSSSLVVWTLEVCCTKAAFYLLHNGAVAWLDIVSLAGYKYVSAVCNLAAFILFGRMAYYSCLLYSASSVGWIVFKSYFEILGGSQIALTEKISMLLVIVGGGQVAMVWFLGMV